MASSVTRHNICRKIWLDGLRTPTVHVLKRKKKIFDCSKCQVVAIFPLSNKSTVYNWIRIESRPRLPNSAAFPGFSDFSSVLHYFVITAPLCNSWPHFVIPALLCNTTTPLPRLILGMDLLVSKSLKRVGCF